MFLFYGITSLLIGVGMVGQRDFDLPSPKIVMKDIHVMLLFLRDSGLEDVGLDLNLSPPPDPPCLLSPCLLRQMALLTPQEDQDSQPCGKDQDQAGGGEVCYVHTSYLSFFLHGQNIWPNFSPRQSA